MSFEGWNSYENNTPQGQDNAFEESIDVSNDAELALSENESNKGVIDYSSLSAEEIQNHINQIQRKIDMLGKRPLSELSDAEFDILIGYQKERKRLKDLHQLALKESITQKKETVRANFEEIKSFLSSDIIHAYPELGDIIENGQQLLEAGHSETLTSEQVEAVTKQALAYLKNNKAVR